MTAQQRNSDASEASARSDKISQLYTAISETSQSATFGTSDAVEAEVSRLWSELRRLQTEEANEYQRMFEATLSMPIDAGKSILEKARRLRESFEDPAADNASAVRSG